MISPRAELINIRIVQCVFHCPSECNIHLSGRESGRDENFTETRKNKGITGVIQWR
jgi:hypothetical protein